MWHTKKKEDIRLGAEEMNRGSTRDGIRHSELISPVPYLERGGTKREDLGKNATDGSW